MVLGNPIAASPVRGKSLPIGIYTCYTYMPSYICERRKTSHFSKPGNVSQGGIYDLSS